MKNKNLIIGIALFYFLIGNVFCQSNNLSTLLIKIMYKDKERNNTEGFFLINEMQLSDLKPHASDALIEESILPFNISKVGGIYISKENFKENTYACIKYGSLSPATDFHIIKDKDKITLDSIKFFDGNLKKYFKKYRSTKLKFSNTHAKYYINIWRVKAHVSVCNFYLNTPVFLLYDNKCGYLEDIYYEGVISKGSKSIIKKNLKVLSKYKKL